MKALKSLKKVFCNSIEIFVSVVLTTLSYSLQPQYFLALLLFAFVMKMFLSEFWGEKREKHQFYINQFSDLLIHVFPSQKKSYGLPLLALLWLQTAVALTSQVFLCGFVVKWKKNAEKKNRTSTHVGNSTIRVNASPCPIADLGSCLLCQRMCWVVSYLSCVAPPPCVTANVWRNSNPLAGKEPLWVDVIMTQQH